MNFTPVERIARQAISRGDKRDSFMIAVLKRDDNSIEVDYYEERYGANLRIELTYRKIGNLLQNWYSNRIFKNYKRAQSTRVFMKKVQESLLETEVIKYSHRIPPASNRVVGNAESREIDEILRAITEQSQIINSILCSTNIDGKSHVEEMIKLAKPKKEKDENLLKVLENKLKHACELYRKFRKKANIVRKSSSKIIDSGNIKQITELEGKTENLFDLYFETVKTFTELKEKVVEAQKNHLFVEYNAEADKNRPPLSIDDIDYIMKDLRKNQFTLFKNYQHLIELINWRKRNKIC